MDTSGNTQATIFGLVSAAVLSNVPSEWLNYGEKLLYGAVLAFVTGFVYKAGGWLWDRITRVKVRTTTTTTTTSTNVSQLPSGPKDP